MMERGTSEMDYLKSILRLLNEELKEQEYANEQFRVLTSMEALYYLLIDTKTEDFIIELGGKVKSKIIDLNQY